MSGPDSESEIILVTDEGSLEADSEPTAIAVYELITIYNTYIDRKNNNI